MELRRYNGQIIAVAMGSLPNGAPALEAHVQRVGPKITGARLRVSWYEFPKHWKR